MMNNQKNLSLYLLFFLSSYLHGQQLLQLNAQHRCLYALDTSFPRDIYSLRKDSIEHLCEDILKATNQPRNFEIIASNIESAAAVLDRSNRYLLYSRKHFFKFTDLAYQIAILAHEIGHHANEHTFEPYNQETEEVEADEFMGFALYRMGVLRNQMAEIASKYPLANYTDSTERQAAIIRGFDRGEASIIIVPHAAFNDDGSGNAIPGIPEFPFPPPLASATYVLDDFFADCKTLADVERRLNSSLKSNGYAERRYFYVKGGFTLVTRLEQINEEGYSLNANRWNPKPVREETFSWTNYLKALLTSQPGYFRVFAFVVTDEPFATKTDRQVSRTDAEAWLSQGCFKLPSQIGQLQYTTNTTVAALVYEFQVPVSNQQPVLSKPSALSGEAHLWNSKITQSLK